ncbi:transposable element Tcb2 transposase [Trichonephila clavipes]|nr:transposable element Tcb2 transposase [Trichonephila clavipes]
MLCCEEEYCDPPTEGCSAVNAKSGGKSIINKKHLCAKIKEEVEKLAYQLNEEAERTERPIRRFRTAIRGFSSGRPRGTTPADDRYIVLQARRNRRQTAGEIATHTTQATGRPILRITVARRLHGGGLSARRPVRCEPLTPVHRRRRSLWCPEHRNWRDNEWGRVLFTDKSRFSLSSDSHRILIWRERGSRNHPSNIIERDRIGGRGVLVWGGIMLDGRTDLHIFEAGSVNGTRYCNEILLPYVRLFRGAMGLQFLFMDDNAPCHRTVVAEQLLESEDIERMDWPARSPDLNSIEYVWDFLGRRMAARTLPPVTIRELRLALQDEWAAMPQQLIDTLILRMGRRCETCLAFTCRNCGGGDRGRVAIYRPFGEVSLSLNRTVTCMVLKANDRRTSCPCHDEFRGPRSDYVRQVIALKTFDTVRTPTHSSRMEFEDKYADSYDPEPLTRQKEVQWKHSKRTDAIFYLTNNRIWTIMN